MRTVNDALLQLKAERDENVCREPFLPSEAVAIGERIEKLERPKAKAQQSAGGGDKKSTSAKKSGRKTFPKRSQNESSRTTAKAASAAGMSRPTYEKAKAVVASGDGVLIAGMKPNGIGQSILLGNDT